MTSAGILRHQITISRLAEVDNGRGGYSDDELVEVARLRARVTGVGGSETVIGQALQGISVYSIRIRYRSDVDASCQIRFGMLDLNVKSAVPDDRLAWLDIVASTASTLAS